MHKTGVIAGKFLPPHVGHLKLVEEASKVCETIYIAISDNPGTSARKCAEQGLPPLPAEIRKKWLEEHFKKQKNVKIIYFDETGLNESQIVEVWCSEFKKFFNQKIDALIVGEEHYVEVNKKYFPESISILIKRGVDSIDISSTQIRNDIKNNIDYIIPEAQKYFKDFLAKK